MTSIAFAFPSSQVRAAPLPVWAAVAMALMSGCLLALAYSLHPLWWAAWVAPVPVIAAALNGQPSWARRLGALAGLIAGSTTFGYYTSVTGWPVAVGILFARVWFWSGMVTLAVRSARRLPAWGAVFAWPASAAGIETVVLAVSPHGSYGSLAYSQMDALPVIQVAALGGVPAIVFMVSCAGALGGLVAGRLMGAVLDARDLAIAAALVTAIWGGVLVFGSAASRLAAGRASHSHPARRHGPVRRRAAKLGGGLGGLRARRRGQFVPRRRHRPAGGDRPALRFRRRSDAALQVADCGEGARGDDPGRRRGA